jgi:arginase
VLVQLIHCDNDSGRPATRMGQGPDHILAGDPAGRLRAAGHQVNTVRVDLRLPFPTEVAAAFETASSIARQVRLARRQRRFPVVLAGNCIASLGVVAGLRPRRGSGRVGVVWLDAHADLHTPATTRSGFLDGMAISVIAGDCWDTLAHALPGFRAVHPEDILLLGARDVDEAERRRIGERGVEWQSVAALRDSPEALATRIDRLANRAEAVHVHVDLDVLDPDVVAAANGYAAPDGLAGDELVSVIRLVATRAPVAALTLSAYDPSFDSAGAVRDVALEVIEVLCSAAAA